MFAAATRKTGRFKMLFVPLHLIDPFGDLVSEIGQFVIDEGVLSHNPLTAELRGACFLTAKLTNACLARAHLAECNFTKARMMEADLANAQLAEANLTDARLDGANLSGAILIGANLKRATFNDARLQGTIFDASARDYLEAQKVELTNLHFVEPNEARKFIRASPPPDATATRN